MLIAWDFNIVHFVCDKIKNRSDNLWPFLSNAFIECLDVRKVTMLGCQFTWVNSLSNLAFEKLDTVLMTIEWELKFPLVTVHAREHLDVFLDHAPLLMDFGSMAFRGKHHKFKFELGWLTQGGLRVYSSRCGKCRPKVEHPSNGGITKCGLLAISKRTGGPYQWNL